MKLQQVKALLYKKHIICQFLRYAHKEHLSDKTVLYPLKSRKLLNIKGDDASVYLQGLITNDMRHFEEGAKSIYAMFLNNKGRVMYDTLIHKWDNNSFLIECDSSIMNAMQKHLKMFKLKRQLEIIDVNEEMKLWALISSTVPDTKRNNFHIYKDPRLVELGFRVISPLSLNKSQLADIFGSDTIIDDNEDGYKYLRYKLGVSEGAEDLPPATSFPLEANLDYLHGVSFHKGCYIGQELTARVHHTGVVRKRIMPLKFIEDVKDSIQKDTVIGLENNPKSNLGKLKGIKHDYALGLIKIKEALDAKILKIGNYNAEVLKPSWWPVEAPREDMDKPKSDADCIEVGYDFKCITCSLSEKAHYKGTKPPFSRNIVLKYSSYVMKDPFSPPGKGEILILGADCAVCEKPVCISKECSIFYTKLFCLNCAKTSIELFPVEIKNKINQYKK